MRTELAQLAVTLVYLAAGIPALVALRVMGFTPREIVPALGLAYLTGVAGLLMAGVLLMCLGLPFSLPVIVVLSLSAALLPGRRVLSGWPPRTRRGRPSVSASALRPWLRSRTPAWWLVVVGAAALAVYAYLGYRAAVVRPLDGWDSWSIWARKAIVLLDSSSMPTAFLTAPEYGFMHADYPLVFPLFESVFFRFAGVADTQAMHGQLWILLVAGLWAAAFLGSRGGRSMVWAAVVALVAVTPAVRTQLLSAYADVPMSLFLMVSVLLLGLWLVGRRREYLVLGVLLLGTTANIKNEGLTAATGALLALVAASALLPDHGMTRLRAMRAPLVAFLGFAVMVAPWRIWMAAHDISGDMPIGKGLSPGYLFDRDERLRPAIEAINAQITNQASWNYLLPMAVAAVAACLICGVARRLATFYLLAGVATFAFIVWAYWISPLDIGYHLSTSADRTVDGLMFVAAAAVLHLGTALVDHGRTDAASAAGGQPAPQESPRHA